MAIISMKLLIFPPIFKKIIMIVHFYQNKEQLEILLIQIDACAIDIHQNDKWSFIKY